MNDKIKLNLGSGKKLKQGYINIDILDCGQEIIRDLENQCIPLNSDSVDEIDADNFLEHVHNLWFVLDECWRVLKKDGTLNVIVPAGLNIAPDHYRYFNQKFFNHYITEGPKEYSFTKRLWKLLSYKETPTIIAKLTPKK